MSRKFYLYALLAVAALIGSAWWLISKPHTNSPPASRNTNAAARFSSELAGKLLDLEAQEQHANNTYWAKEILAQECGRAFEQLWDSLNRSSSKLATLAEFNPGTLLLGKLIRTNELPHHIQHWLPAGVQGAFDFESWGGFLAAQKSAGWQLDQCELRQVTFDTDEEGRPQKSTFQLSAHLQNPTLDQRAALDGPVVVTWHSPSNALPSVQQIDATRVTLKTRTGPTFFRIVTNAPIIPPERSRVADPLIVYDLDGDGLPEIALIASNVLLRRQQDGTYQKEPLCRYPTPYIASAVIADFDGDGFADLLCCKYEGVFLFRGSAGGKFEEKEKLVAKPNPPLRDAMVMTCGDIDGDGDLDLFIGQYREPYEGWITPKPFFAANDGNPAFLLLNDGHGNFSDNTAAAGLTSKRQRRTYSAAFVSLFAEDRLDLVVVSDFAGADIYRNLGSGRFEDVTSTALPDPHAFGMASAFADFNRDGLLDFLMIGMTSPAVQRLDHLGLYRPLKDSDKTMRTRMTAGNRLYLADVSGRFRQSELSRDIANSGWSWGCSALDADNDGFPDVYIANGLESNSSVHDYEAEYWLHDQFIGADQEEPASELYFKSKLTRTRSRDYSYGGYEKNRFYLNLSGQAFVEAGYLAGAALEQDCRNVVAADLDGDGRDDLVVTTLEVWPAPREQLFILRNEIPESGNWIGFRFSESKRHSALGTRVTLEAGGFKTTHQLLVGDSYRSQHPATIKFGLGSVDSVDRVEVHYPDGNRQTLTQPGINRYHKLN